MTLNAVDLLMVIVIAIIVRAGWSGRIVSEFIKLFGVLCAIFIALHYYARFAVFLQVQFFGKNVSTKFLAFSLLAVLLASIFIFISHGWVLIVRMKYIPKMDRYGGLVLSLIRSYFACGLIFFALILIGHQWITPMAQRSVSSAVFRHVAENFYRTTHAKLIEGFFPNEIINQEALALTAEKEKK